MQDFKEKTFHSNSLWLVCLLVYLLENLNQKPKFPQPVQLPTTAFDQVFVFKRPIQFHFSTTVNDIKKCPESYLHMKFYSVTCLLKLWLKTF